MAPPGPVGHRHVVQLISGHSVDSSPSLLVYFEHNRYLFNAPENTSRICVQSRTAMKKIKAVFLGTLQDSVGLPGSILSAVEGGASKLEVYGPDGTDHLMASCRSFTRRDQLSLKITMATPLSTHSALPAPIFSDKNMTVHAFPLSTRPPSPSLKRKRSGSPSLSDSTSYDSTAPDFNPLHLTGEAAKHWRGRVVDDMFRGRALKTGPTFTEPPRAMSPGGTTFRSQTPAHLSQPLPAFSQPVPTAVSYLCIGPTVPGQFLVQNAQKLEIPKQFYAKLKKRERTWIPTLPPAPVYTKEMSKAEKRSVKEARQKLESEVVDGVGEGKWVEPEEVVLPPQDGSAFLILNLPTVEFLPSLSGIPSSVFTELKDARLENIYYILGPNVVSSAELSAFVSSFPSNITHSIVAPEISGNPLTFGPAALLTSRLSLLSPTIFPLPASQTPTEPVALPGNAVALRPAELMVSPTPPPPQAYVEAAAALSLPPPPEVVAAAPGSSLTVTTLGTGSAIPSKYRNVSSTLLHDPESGTYILLDAGEGTWGQLCRRFGEGVDEILRNLDAIFISHMHQDHHAGLATILKHRNALKSPSTKPLTIIAPPQARMYLFDQQGLFDLGLRGSRDIDFVDNWYLEAGKEFDESRVAAMKGLYDRTGLTSITTVPVLHRCRCWGIVIAHSSGWKAVFSGDTMPCDALVKAGKGATLLIHEATMDDDLPEMASLKGHSTFGQAIDVARRMEATYVLLTHFSARYPKLPPLNHEPPPIVAVAFDLMTLRLDEFWIAHKFLPVLDLLLGGGEAEVEGEEATEGDAHIAEDQQP